MAEVERHSGGGNLSRRDLLRAGGHSLWVGAAAAGAFERTLLAANEEPRAAGAPGDRRRHDAHPERILVVVELSGGNDGLDTFVPYRDDAYHRARPSLRRRRHDIALLDENLAIHGSLAGLLRLWHDGRVALVEGCGYPGSSRSHFAAAAAWHTAAPGVTEERGWIGRLADALWPEAPAPVLVNIAKRPSLALRSSAHTAFVFSGPDRPAHPSEPRANALEASDRRAQERPASDAGAAALRVRDAVRDYRTPVDYGASCLGRDLRSVAALVGSGFPARVYYASAGGFDTHASQANGRDRLLAAVGDALYALEQDLRRLGRDREVATLVFSEFGRRLEENASQGTDHGTAGPVLVAGGAVVPGLHGAPASLTEPDADGDVVPTTDFRRVYASVIEEWFGCRDGATILHGQPAPLGLFV